MLSKLKPLQIVVLLVILAVVPTPSPHSSVIQAMGSLAIDAEIDYYLPVVYKNSGETINEITTITGGVITANTNEFSLLIPPNSSETAATIRYNMLTLTAPTNYQFRSGAIELIAEYDNGKLLETTDKEMTLTMAYTDNNRDLENGNLSIYQQIDEQNNWQQISSTIYEDLNIVTAQIDEFGTYAVMNTNADPIVYEVGEPDYSDSSTPPANEFAYITDAFLSAYYRNGGEADIGLPSSHVKLWAGAWVQDFVGATLIYNEDRGTAFYIYGDFTAIYGGPGSFLGLPVTDRYDPPNDALLLDRHTNFMGDQIQQFEFGFIGNDSNPSNGSGYMTHPYYPIISGASIQVEHYDPDENDDVIETKARVSVDVYDIYPNPTYKEWGEVGSAHVEIHIEDGSFSKDWVPNEGLGVKVWEGLEPDGDFSLWLEGWVNNVAGYLECDTYERKDAGDDYVIGPISLESPGFYERYYNCGGLSGGGGGGGFRDTSPPVIMEPTIWQNGRGWANLSIPVTDNVGVDIVKVFLNGEEYFATLVSGGARDGVYEVNVPLKIGVNDAYIMAWDYAGNPARYPANEDEFIPIPSTMDGLHGDRPYIGKSDDPVNSLLGNFFYNYIDLEIVSLGPDVILERWFNGMSLYEGMFGTGWTFSYDMRLTAVDNLLLQGVQIRYGDGHTVNFQNENGEFVSDDLPYDIVVPSGDGYDLITRDNTVYSFNGEGRLASVADEDGNTITLTYDGDNLASLTNASGRTLEFAYNGEGQVTAIDVPGYGILTYAYEDGRLVSATDTEGNESIYTYDENGCMVSITSPNGNPYLNTQTCDEDGRITYQLGGTGWVNEFVYDDDNLTTTIVDPFGNETTHIYSEEFHLIEDQDELGNSITYTYNDDYLPLTMTDKNGNTTTYTYDDRGNPLTVTDAAGNLTVYVYDGNNDIVSRTDPLGNVYLYDYEDGHLVRSTAPDGGVVEREYDDNGRPVRVTDELGNVTITEYNNMGLPVAVTDALGNTATMVYDEAGHLLSQTDALGFTATYEYNSLGLVESVTDPEGYVTSYVYDSDRNLVNETGPDGQTMSYTYDENGRRVAETDWGGNSTTYEYDDLGRLTRETDPLGYTTTYEYDAIGNLIAMTDKRGATATYTYDANSNRLTSTDALGRTTTYTYDNLNRQIQIEYPCDCPSRVEQKEYDALGRLVSKTDPNGNTTTYEYDALGRQTGQVDALGFATSKTYDVAGNLRVETDALGQTTVYEYDALNRLVETTNRLGFSTSTTYDDGGRMIATTNERGYKTEFVYDGNNRMVEEIDALGNRTVYTYDGRGNTLTVTDALGRVTINEYDDDGNLVRTTNPRGFSTSFVYDERNQRTSMTDALGYTTTYTYDAEGAQLSETDAFGYTKETVYDLIGRTITEIDRNGNETTTVYDLAGNVSQIVDALGGVKQYTYDPNRNRLTATDELGYTTTYEYDALNRQVVVRDALDGVSTRSYDGLGRLVEVVDANGHATTYEYDAEGQQIAMTDALGHTSTAEFDPSGNVTREVDRNGNVTLHQFDALNREIVLTNGLGNSATTVFDEVGNVVFVTNFRGYTTTYQFDPNNNLIEIIDALDGRTTYEYDALDRELAETDANGHTTTRTYDAVGNLLSVTLPEGESTSFTYDGQRNRTSVTNGRGFTTTFAYDALNRQIRITDPLDHITTTVYDAIDQEIEVIDANGNSNQYEYDALGRLVTVTDALGYVTTYSYDSVGNQLSKTDANNQIHVYEYDAVNRLIQETDATNHVWLYTYDPEGNLVERVDANEDSTTYLFDAIHQLIGLRYADEAQNVDYVYDENGNLIQIIDPVGTTQLVYDALDREVEKVDGYGRVVTTEYDPVGNRTKLTYPDGNPVTYFYNGNNWLITMVDPRAGQTSYSYEGDGQVRTVDKPNDTWESNVYDDASRLISVFNGTYYHDGVITSFAYTLDPVGNRLQVVEEYTQGQIRTNIKTYQYNARYEVVEAVELYEGPPEYTVTTTYTYDPVGNRLSMTSDRDIGPGPQPEPETTTYTYDAANRLLTAGNMTYTYDNNGNRLTKLTETTPASQSRLEIYEYDIENRMTAYSRERVNNGHVEQRVFNIYDGLGRRMNKGLQESSGVIKWTEYTLDGLTYDQLVEYPQTGPPRVTELYRGLDNQLVSMDEIQGSGQGSQYWFSQDGSGNVTASTKQNGQSAHEYFYDPYGQLIDENGHWEDSSSWTDPHNHYLLTGKEWDEESRLYYFGARFYDSEAGVWLTADPYRGDIETSNSLHAYWHLGPNGLIAGDNVNHPMGTHRYLYVQNNPINRVDPLGFFDWSTGRVEHGDSLWQIAHDAGVSLEQIVAWNPQLGDPNVIFPGQYIELPADALQAGKLAEAIRQGAGADPPRWGKYTPDCQKTINQDITNCPEFKFFPSIDYQLNFPIATGVDFFIGASVGMNGSTIKGEIRAGTEFDLLNFAPGPLDKYLRKADKWLHKLTGLRIYVNLQIGIKGEFEYNICTKDGEIKICGFAKLDAGIEKRRHRIKDSSGQYSKQRWGVNLSAEAKICASLCNGDVTWEFSGSGSVYAHFGKKRKLGPFKPDFSRVYELGFDFDAELKKLTTIDRLAILEDYCGN